MSNHHLAQKNVEKFTRREEHDGLEYIFFETKLTERVSVYLHCKNSDTHFLDRLLSEVITDLEKIKTNLKSMGFKDEDVNVEIDTYEPLVHITAERIKQKSMKS